ncbi:MAG: sensor histidine kinase [Thermoanaerobaculia bacterium]
MSTETPTDRSPRAEDRDDDLATRLRRLAAENERLFREVARSERRFRRLSRAVWQVQEEEHRRLARELHDGLGQLLVALKGRLEMLSRGDLDTAATSAVAECVAMAAEALEQTRELSRLLRPTVLDDLGLESALRWLARTLRARSGLEVALTTRGAEQRIDPDIETLAFRVVQEALTNVLKHSGTRQAEVDLAVEDQQLRLVVRDRGRGFEPQRALAELEEHGGLGLRGIHDRVGLLGGRTRVESTPGAGTTLHVRVPLNGRDEAS